MAAQDYYQGGSGSMPPAPAAQSSRPPPNPAPLQVPGNPPYPLYDGPPPPYSPGEHRANSQPPPHRRMDSLGESLSEKPQSRPQQSPRIPQQSPRLPQRPPPEHQASSPSLRPSVAEDYDRQFRPAVRQQHSYAYPEEKRNGGHSPGYPPQQYGQYGAPPVQPYTAPINGNNVAFAPNAQYYPPPRERERSRSRTRSRSRSRSRERRKSQQKKKSSVSTFLGAGGGALMGDLIFPGLGTIGGALLGGIGGHEYGKQKSKDTRRDRRHSDSDDYHPRPSRRN